jgi:hypothetical protein
MGSPPSAARRARLDPSINPCPDDVADVADLYCLKRLSAEEEALFEEHWLQCPDCAEEVERSQEFIDTLRTAIDRD